MASTAYDNVVKDIDFQELTCAIKITGDFNIGL